MKLPKAFMPEKALDKNTEKLLTKKLNFAPTRASLDKVVFDNLSFKQLKELASLEGKIYELKISFGYKNIKHEIVFTSYSERSSGRGSLKLMQYPPGNHLALEELISCVKDIAIFSHSFVVSHRMPPDDYCSMVEFYPKRFSSPPKRLEQFFDKEGVYLLDFSFLGEVSIHVEYHNMTANEYAMYAGK